MSFLKHSIGKLGSTIIAYVASVSNGWQVNEQIFNKTHDTCIGFTNTESGKWKLD